MSLKRIGKSLVLTALAMWAIPARAQLAPAWSRGLQQLPIRVSEASSRAEAAMQAEGYNVTNRSNPSEDSFFLGGQKGQHSAIIMCDRGADGKTWVNVVVATNGADSDVPGLERQRLQARMNNTAMPPAAPQTGPGGGYGPGSGPVDMGTRLNGTWSSRANELEQDMPRKTGRRYTITFPPGGHAEGVWGTDLYTADSRVGSAAVHAGLLTFERGGPVTIEIRP